MKKVLSTISVLLMLALSNQVNGACLPSSELICDDTPVVATSKLAERKVDSVLVKKSERRMYLMSKGEIYREYKVVFGGNPVGHKEKEGDKKTPEGNYFLDYKKADSSFYKAIHISYPNDRDIEKAENLGVDPGGLIMIHGQKNGFGWLSFFSQSFNWTNGCIAVTNSEMDEIWQLIEIGTPIEIRP